MKSLCFKNPSQRYLQIQNPIKPLGISFIRKTSLQNGLCASSNILIRTYAKPKGPPTLHKNNAPTLKYIHKKNKPKLQKEMLKRERRQHLRTIQRSEDVDDEIPQSLIPFGASPRKLRAAEEKEDIEFNRALLKAQQQWIDRKRIQKEDEEVEDQSASINEAEKEEQLLEQELQEDEKEDQTDPESALVARRERDEALVAKHQWLKMVLDKPIVQLVQEKRYQEAEDRYLKLTSDPTFRLTPQIFEAMLECYAKMKQPEKVKALIAANVHKGSSTKEKKPLLPANPLQTISLNTATYEQIIKSLGASGDVSSMMDYFHEMVNIKKIQPSLMLMNSMIHAYAAANDAEAVEKCFKLLKQSGLRPNVHSYALVMDFFEKRGDLKMVANYHDLMVKQNLEPTVDIWRSLVKSCKKSFKYDKWNLRQTRGVWHIVKKVHRKRLEYSEAEKIKMARLMSNFKAMEQDL